MHFDQLKRCSAARQAAWPFAVKAQRPALWRIGFLLGVLPVAQSRSDDVVSGFLQGMRELGYSEGQDFVVGRIRH